MFGPNDILFIKWPPENLKTKQNIFYLPNKQVFFMPGKIKYFRFNTSLGLL